MGFLSLDLGLVFPVLRLDLELLTTYFGPCLDVTLVRFDLGCSCVALELLGVNFELAGFDL